MLKLGLFNNTLVLGESILIDHKLVRHWKSNGDKEWLPKRIEPPIYAYVMGIRTLSNGSTDYDRNYAAKTYIKAFLVVTDLKSKPFYVYREDDFDYISDTEAKVRQKV